MTRNYLFSNLIVALGYLASGQVGLLLAIPPSNAAPVWPAAGVALAAMLISGNKVLPGIFLGAFLTQTISFLDFSNSDKIFSSLLIGAVIAAGSLYQAWLGTRLTHRIFKQDDALLKERSIMMFCIMAGPVSCLVSPSIGIYTLWFRGILTITDIPLAWSTWWIGDSIGVLIFTPLMLCFFGNPRHFWRQRIISVAMPLSILLLISFILFEYAYQQEMERIEDKFEKNSIHFTRELESSINIYLEATLNLKAYFDSVSKVSADEFSRFVQPTLSRNPEIKALEWIPKILNENRSSFENYSGFQIKNTDSNGEMKRSSNKDYYYPIKYLEPYLNNENALGFDIRNNPIALKAVEEACFSGKVAVTGAINLVQQQKGQVGIVFYAPVYKNKKGFEYYENCKMLSGVVASVFGIEHGINNIHERLPELNVLVSLKNNSSLFYSDISETEQSHTIPNQFQFKRVFNLSIANQQWELLFSPAAGFISIYSSWTIWLVIIAGLLISACSGMGLLMLTGRALRTEELVTLRTKELNSEVEDRKKIGDALLEAKDEAEAATQAKSQFLANMSHEIRTPMNGVLGMSQVLQGTELTLEQSDCVNTIYSSGNALLNIINDILDFSKIEAGKLDIEPIPFDLQVTLLEIAELLQPKCEEKNIDLIVDYASDAPRHFTADPGRLRQIIMNLAGNAIKFTSEGHVLIELQCVQQNGEEAELRFAVTDTGIGISDEAQITLFESFSQADPSTTRKFGGTGLGLSISKQLVEMMGGKLSVDSELGKGSTFWFTLHLPGSAEKQSSPIAHMDFSDLRSLLGGNNTEQSLSVLLVEDNIVNQKVARKLLEKNGCMVDVAANGKEGVEMHSQFHYDIVFMDCQMPVLDGYEATMAIRKNEEDSGKHQVIIAMTANAIKGDREKCISYGMDDYITKPVDGKKLQEIIRLWSTSIHE